MKFPSDELTGSKAVVSRGHICNDQEAISTPNSGDSEGCLMYTYVPIPSKQNEKFLGCIIFFGVCLHAVLYT